MLMCYCGDSYHCKWRTSSDKLQNKKSQAVAMIADWPMTDSRDLIGHVTIW